MNSLVSYGSDDEVESDHFGSRSSVGAGGKRKEDDTNYDDVNMDLSEDSQGAGSEPEQPGAEHAHVQQSKSTRPGSNDSRERERLRDRDCDRDRDRDRDHDRDRTSDMRDRRRDKERYERDRERRSPRRDDKYNKDRSERSRGPQDAPRRGLLGDKPRERSTENKVPALMDLKPYGGEPPPGLGRSHDARDAVSPRFVERDRRERDDKRERDRDRESRHSRRSEETRSSRDKGSEHRSRSRGAAYPPPYSSSSNEKRSSPSSGDYRPSSYKVNKKLEVMEKMGLQIKTPDGSMATAQQLRAAASEAPAGSGAGLPTYNNPTIANSNKILDQVQKRKLLWSNKEKSVAVAEAAKWSGARFAQDNDGKQVSKFMRLMGIKEPAAVKAPEQVDETVDPNKKQEELFQAMQAQYEVARATTHTMRGVGLGFQRGNF